MTPVTPAQVEALIERMRERGTIGLDMSPGDPDCSEAASALAGLRLELSAERVKTEIWKAGATKLQADREALRDENAALRKELDDIDAMCRAALAAAKKD